MFWNNFEKLCKLNNIKPNPLAKKIDIASSTVTSWKNGAIPNGETLIKIADYFNVSIDYLLDRTNNPNLTEKNSISQQVTNSSAHGNITLTANKKNSENESIEQEILEELKNLNFIEKSEVINCIANIKKRKTKELEP